MGGVKQHYKRLTSLEQNRRALMKLGVAAGEFLESPAARNYDEVREAAITAFWAAMEGCGGCVKIARMERAAIGNRTMEV